MVNSATNPGIQENKIYVGNLAWSVTDRDLADYFGQVGELRSAFVVSDRFKNRSKGFGYVGFESPVAARIAVAGLDKSTLHGRCIQVSIARPMEPRPPRMVGWSRSGLRRDFGGVRRTFEEEVFRGSGFEVHITQPTREIGIDVLTLRQARILWESSPIATVEWLSAALIKKFSSHPGEIFKLTSRQFEELVAELFRGFGFEVELTPRSRDGGVDVIARLKSIVNVCYFIECKKPRKLRTKITIEPVRQLYGVSQARCATKSILATTSSFTLDAIQFFKDKEWQIEGRDLDGVMAWIAEYVSRKGN